MQTITITVQIKKFYLQTSPDIARVVRNEFTLQFGAVTGVSMPVFRPESVVPARFCRCWAYLPLTPVVDPRAGAALGDDQEVSR